MGRSSPTAAPPPPSPPVVLPTQPSGPHNNYTLIACRDDRSLLIRWRGIKKKIERDAAAAIDPELRARYRPRSPPSPTTMIPAGARGGHARALLDGTHTRSPRLITHQPAVLLSQNKPTTGNQPAVLFSHNKPAPAISHQPTEQAHSLYSPPTRARPWGMKRWRASPVGVRPAVHEPGVRGGKRRGGGRLN
jgi:hypothetical protein